MGVLNILKEVRRMKKNTKLPREEILKVQEEKLHKIIEHVLKNSKFYREYYGSHGITLENYKDIEYSKYPTIDKSIITNNFDDLICTKEFKLKELEEFVSHKENRGKRYNKKYVVMTSSGSTGNPAIFVYDKKAWTTVKAFIPGRVDTSHRMNLLTKERMAFLITARINAPSYKLAMEAEHINYSTLILSVNEGFDKIVDALREFDPTILSGYSSSIAHFAEEKLKGNLDISPKRIFCSADKLTPERRNTIERAFGVSPVDFYAASEALGMASQIPKSNKLFLFEDYYRLEIVNERLEEVSPGETGNLIVTNLYNYIMPLLRYRMEDRLKKSEDQNFNFTLIDEIVGRTVDDLSFERADGSIDSINGIQLAAIYFKGIKKFQFIQEDKNTLKIRYVLKEEIDPDDEILPKITKLLELKNFKECVKVEMEEVKNIPVDPFTGKYRQIIPLKER